MFYARFHKPCISCSNWMHRVGQNYLWDMPELPPTPKYALISYLGFLFLDSWWRAVNSSESIQFKDDVICTPRVLCKRMNATINWKMAKVAGPATNLTTPIMPNKSSWIPYILACSICLCFYAWNFFLKSLIWKFQLEFDANSKLSGSLHSLKGSGLKFRAC